MKKLSAFVFAMLAASAGCQMERSGLVEGASVSGIDGGMMRDTGRTAIDGGGAKDGTIAPRDATTIDGAALATGGTSGTTIPRGIDGAAGGTTSTPVTGSGGVVSAGGAVGSGGAPAAGGSAGSPTTVVSSGGSGSPDASVPTDVSSKPDLVIPGPDLTIPTPDAAPAMTLIWSDEFDGEANSRADSTKWTYVTWPAGQMNNEKQQYTDRVNNAFLDGKGDLVIRAIRKENQYTSARLDTKGKFSFRTGRIEVRAKLPSGLGSAPGIVLVGTTGTWPTSGELALMEQGGQDKSWFNSTAYAGGASGETGPIRYDFPNATTASTDFHVYSLDWYADGLVFQVDGNNITSTTYDATSPFASVPESIVLYVAVGGDMGGSVGEAKSSSMDMVVDYVRVYAF